jgi:hypothetical protein
MPDRADELPERHLPTQQLLDEGAARLVDGVERLGAAWVVDAVTRIVEAWGRLDEPTRAHTLAAARAAGEEASARVVAELRALFATDVADQRVTPLEIIRSLRTEATAVLRDAGIPEVERDDFETRSFPDDVYGIVLKAPAELGDEDLGGALLAWGMGKANALRANSDQRGKDRPAP